MPSEKSSSIPLSAQNLTVGYDSPLIRDICLQVREGEILALIGPNGSGKSTILKTLAHQLRELGGAVYLDGQEAGRVPPKQAAQAMALLLTESIRPDRMTCREVVETGRYPYTGYFGVLSPADRVAAQEAISLVEAEDFAGALFSQISDGQRQRILLARALCQQPKVLLLDEPTAFLDIYHKVTFLELLRRLADQRRLAVVVTMHEPDMAGKIADYAVCIKEGEVYRAGLAGEVLTPEGIQALFGISPSLYAKYFCGEGGHARS